MSNEPDHQKFNEMIQIKLDESPENEDVKKTGYFLFIEHVDKRYKPPICHSPFQAMHKG